MRIELIREAPHLWESPKELAATLHRAELYSRSTSIHQIVKFLPSLLAEASERQVPSRNAGSSDILIRASEIVDFAWAGRKIIWHNLA